MADSLRIRAAARTDVGKKRDHNEDAYLCAVSDNVFVVADGVGGAAAGEVASEIAIETVRAVFLEEIGKPLGDRLARAATVAHERIVERAASQPGLSGMGAAVVAVAYEPRDRRMAMVNVGDARGYRVRRGGAEQLSQDHTLVQQLLDQGRIEPADIRSHPHRHVLTQALGAADAMSPTVRLEDVEPGDCFALCSDGIHDLVSGEEIAAAVERSEGDLDLACERLVALALERGGHDNATILLVACETPPASTATRAADPLQAGRSERSFGGVEVSEWKRHAKPWFVGAAVAIALMMVAVQLGRMGRVVIAPDVPVADGHESVAPSAATPAIAWASVSPSAPELLTVPGARTEFGAQVSASDGVTYRWLIDGREQAAGPAWTFAPMSDDAGTTRTVTAVASRGDEHLERTWRVRVMRAPIIASTAPEGAVLKGGTGIPLRVAASDPEGGVLTFRWERNGVAIPAADGAAITIDDAHENDEIQVTVAAAGGSATHRWRVEAGGDEAVPGSKPPRVVAQVPAADRPVQVQEGAATEFRVRLAAADPSLRYVWYLDDAEVGRDVTWTFRPPALLGPAGTVHRVDVLVATATGVEAPRVGWNVRIDPAPPTIAGASPAKEAVSVPEDGRVDFGVESSPRNVQPTFEWLVDGRKVQEGAQTKLAFEGPPGPHVVEVVAVDGRGLRSTPRRWRVDVGAPPATTTPSVPDGRLTEAGAREWLARYQSAMEHRDMGQLTELGVVHDPEQAGRLEASLSRLPLVGIRTERVEVDPDGQHATVAFVRMHRDGEVTKATGVVTCRLGRRGDGVAGDCANAAR